jgi:cytochrome c
MNIRHLSILTAGLLLSANAFADEALFKKSGCVACHQVDKKTVGPALKDIAAKYKGVAGAAATLEKKVRSGGTGNWGAVAMMPAPATVSDADIKTLVAWVLATK